MSVDMFGRYQSQTTRQLAQIQSSKYPDTDKDLEANLHRVNQFVDYIAQYLQVMQKGVDQANEDAIQRTRDMAADLVVLLGGGELLYGIDLGDLQYFLPALGAIFGFDSDKPFPISLFEMAEHFLLGYVIPLDSFVLEIQSIIDGWLVAMGVDQEFIDAMDELLGAINAVTTDTLGLFEDLWGLLDVLGINTDGFGPFADLWHTITQLLGSFGLAELGDLVDPVLHALAPWISEIAQFVDMLDSIIKAFSGGLTDVQGLLNLGALITPFTDLMASAFDPLTAWSEIFTNALLPDFSTGLGGIPFFSNLTTMIPGLDNLPGIFDPQIVWNSIITDFINPSGLLEAVGAAWEDLYSELTGGQSGGLTELGNLLTGGLFGLIDPDRIPLVNIGNIGQIATNLLINPSFDGPNSIFDPFNIWTWDDVNGYSVPGSVQVTADGVLKELASNTIPVTEAQEVNIAIRAMWEGLVYTGTFPIKVEVVPYNGNLVVPPIVTVGGLASPATNQAWTELGGTYTVPSGVTRIEQVLRVENTATAGDINFDDGKVNQAGLLPKSFIDGLLGDLAGLLPIGDHLDLLDILSGGTGGGLTQIASRFAAFDPFGFFDSSFLTNMVNHPPVPNTAVPGLNDIADLVTQGLLNPDSVGNAIDAIRDNLGSLLDGIRQGADGTPSTGSIIPDLLAAFTGLRQSMASNSVGLSQIQQYMPSIGGSTGGGAGGGVTGNSFIDDCERAAAVGWGPNWINFGVGGVRTDGHRWYWQDSGGSQRIQYGIYSAGQTLTDYQSVKDVMSSVMESPQAWTGAGPNSNNWLIARAGTDGTRFVLLARFYNRVELYDYNNGSFTLIPKRGGGSGSISANPTAGSRWELECGNALGIRVFTAYMNGGVVGVWEDVGAITVVGASNRYAGQGMMSDPRSGGEATPGSIDLWSVNDKEPPSPTTVIGSGAKIFRTNAAAVTLSNTTAEALMPTNLFDTIAAKSADITVDLVNGKFTVSEDGWYRVGYRLATNAFSGDIDSLLYRTPVGGVETLYEYGDSQTGVTNLKSDWSVYLKAGDAVRIGLKLSTSSSTDPTATGESQGIKSWMKIALMNRSLL